MPNEDADAGRGLTALVTGASAGIGKAFAEVFASHGFDVILTARREERLKALAAELEATYRVRAHVLPADLSDPGATGRLMNQIEAAGLRVDALVNNAGFGLAHPYAFSEWSPQHDLLQVNVVAACELTHRCLPAMVERRRGYVINLGSIAGLVPGSPGYSLYGPSKSFLIQFSRSLHVELYGSGVHVTAVCPGLTRTEFHAVARDTDAAAKFAPFAWMSPGRVAREGFDAVMRNQPVQVSGVLNQLYARLGKYVPDPLITWLFRTNYKQTHQPESRL